MTLFILTWSTGSYDSYKDHVQPFYFSDRDGLLNTIATACAKYRKEENMMLKNTRKLSYPKRTLAQVELESANMIHGEAESVLAPSAFIDDDGTIVTPTVQTIDEWVSGAVQTVSGFTAHLDARRAHVS